MKKVFTILLAAISINAMADCPGLSVIINPTPISCSGSCNGGASAGVSGGSGNYTINYYDNSFNLLGSGVSINNLCAGTYNVVVEDITASCFDTTQFILNNPPPLTAVPSSVNTTCNGGCDGSAIINVTGGTAPYTFMWTGPNGFSSTAPMVNGLCAGTYICYITDANGCTTVVTTVVSQPSPVVVSVTSTAATCGLCDGTATASATGGAGSYVYSWSNGQTGNPASALCAGNYSVTVVDANGCSGTGSVNVSSNGMAASATNVVMTTCNQCNGSADIVVTGGISPYTYLLDSVQTSDGVYTNLCPGVHIATVTDSAGCTTYYTLTIGSTQTGSLTSTSSVINETGFNMNDGSIDLTVSGGTGPYTYQWNNGATTEDIYSLAGGLYSVWVTDQNGDCNYFQVTVNTTQSFGVITGILYADNNQNCVFDTGDTLLSGQWVHANGFWGYTNASGQYSITVPAGNYIVQPAQVSQVTSGCPSSQSVTVTNGGTVNADFSINIIPFYNVCTYAYSLGIVPGFAGNYYIYIQNTGNMTASGDLCFILPADLNYTGSSPAGATVNGDTICWTYTNLAVGAYMWFNVSFLTPASLPLGTNETACFSTTITNGSPSNPSCGQGCYSRLVTGSFDPNDKSVSPAGEGPAGDIGLTEDELVYLVQFQNTGTGPAVNITITDTLSPLLDLTTFEMLNASHNYSVDFFNGNIIRWKFNNINLPDSGSNEPASHGFVQFRIRTLNAPQQGQVVNNSANIYFDFNAPVITNTAVNTYVIPGGISELNGISMLSVFPNPSSSLITIRINDNSGNIPVNIHDVAGRKVRTLWTQGGTATTDVSALDPGMYFISVTINGKLYTQPVIISR